MKMRCIFNAVTGRGVDCDREQREGEFRVELLTKDIGWFMSDPGRYQYVDGVFGECQSWATEQTQQQLQAQKKAIAAQRYAMETANMLHDGHEWYMDREARTTLYLTIAEVLSGDLPEEYFKTATGWYLITPENAGAIKQAGRNHVKAAFAWEKSEVEKLV